MWARREASSSSPLTKLKWSKYSNTWHAVRISCLKQLGILEWRDFVVDLKNVKYRLLYIGK